MSVDCEKGDGIHMMCLPLIYAMKVSLFRSLLDGFRFIRVASDTSGQSIGLFIEVRVLELF